MRAFAATCLPLRHAPPPQGLRALRPGLRLPPAPAACLPTAAPAAAGRPAASTHAGPRLVLIHLRRPQRPSCPLQYKLLLADDLHLEPTSGGSRSGGEQPAAAAGPRARRGDVSRLTSWPAEAAAEAAAAAQRIQRQRLERQSASGGCALAGRNSQQLPVDCFAELQYQARVKGFMQPRR